MVEQTQAMPWAKIGASWGHPWHRMCSYLGSYPPALARSLTAMFSRPGDVVYDPFSGRGTTLLEARLLGRVALASDLNPIAYALTAAKAATVSPEDVFERVDQLENRYRPVLYAPEARVQSDDIQLIFNIQTLAQLCYLRKKLVSPESDVDKFLTGVVLGVMHGSERRDGTSSYASINMPNTFSMSPGYVKKYVAEKLNRPYRDVFAVLRRKLKRLFLSSDTALLTEQELPAVAVWSDVLNSADSDDFQPYHGKVDLVLASPPYLGVVNYAKQNWIRHWFMEKHDCAMGAGQLADGLTLDRWLDFMDEVVDSLGPLLSDRGIVAFVIGDVARNTGGRISLAREFLHRQLHAGCFQYIGCFNDEIKEGAKVSRIWGETRGRATDTDRIVLLGRREPSVSTKRLSEAFGSDIQIDIATDRFDAVSFAQYARGFASLETN